MLIINAYFWFCNMCATSDANALIVNWSRFRGGKVPHFWPENAAVLGMKCYGRVCLHSSPRIFFSIFSYTSYTFWRKHQSVLEVFVCRMTWKILHPCRMNLHFEEKERQNEVKNAPASGRIPRWRCNFLPNDTSKGKIFDFKRRQIAGKNLLDV